MKVLIDADSLIYRACHDVITVEEAYDKFTNRIDYIKGATWADESELYVRGPENFRQVDFPLYKANRAKANPDSIVPELYAYLEEQEIGIQAEGCEADDLVRIAAHQARENKEEFVVAAVDKDLYVDPFTFYNYFKDEIIVLDEEEANANYYKQLLTGDSGDNIRGLHRVGPVKAQKILDKGKPWQERCREAYKEAFGSDHEDVITLVGHLIHIKRSEDDWFDIGYGTFYDRKPDIDKMAERLGYSA